MENSIDLRRVFDEQMKCNNSLYILDYFRCVVSDIHNCRSEIRFTGHYTLNFVTDIQCDKMFCLINTHFTLNSRHFSVLGLSVFNTKP